MLSLNDRRKIIKYLDEHKKELKDIQKDFKLAIKELETKDVQIVLTKKLLDEILSVSILFMRFISALNDKFEEE